MSSAETHASRDDTGDDARSCTRAWCSDCAAFLPTEEFTVSSLVHRKRTCKACVSRRNAVYRASSWSVFVAAEARRAARRRGESCPDIKAADVVEILKQHDNKCPLTSETDPRRLRLARLRQNEPFSRENCVPVAKRLRPRKAEVLLAAWIAQRSDGGSGDKKNPPVSI